MAAATQEPTTTPKPPRKGFSFWCLTASVIETPSRKIPTKDAVQAAIARDVDSIKSLVNKTHWSRVVSVTVAVVLITLLIVAMVILAKAAIIATAGWFAHPFLFWYFLGVPIVLMAASLTFAGTGGIVAGASSVIERNEKDLALATTKWVGEQGDDFDPPQTIVHGPRESGRRFGQQPNLQGAVTA